MRCRNRVKGWTSYEAAVTTRFALLLTAETASRIFCSFTVAIANLVCFGKELVEWWKIQMQGLEIRYASHDVHCGVVALWGRDVYSLTKVFTFSLNS